MWVRGQVRSLLEGAPPASGSVVGAVTTDRGISRRLAIPTPKGSRIQVGRPGAWGGSQCLWVRATLGALLQGPPRCRGAPLCSGAPPHTHRNEHTLLRPATRARRCDVVEEAQMTPQPGLNAGGTSVSLLRRCKRSTRRSCASGCGTWRRLHFCLPGGQRWRLRSHS